MRRPAGAPCRRCPATRAPSTLAAARLRRVLLVALPGDRAPRARERPARPWPLRRRPASLPLIWRRRAPVAVVRRRWPSSAWCSGSSGCGSRPTSPCWSRSTPSPPRSPRRALLAASRCSRSASSLAAVRFAPTGDAVGSFVFLTGLVAAAVPGHERAQPPRLSRRAGRPRRAAGAGARPAGPPGRHRRARPDRPRDARHRRAQPLGHRRARRRRRGVRAEPRPAGPPGDAMGQVATHRPRGAGRDAAAARRAARPTRRTPAASSRPQPGLRRARRAGRPASARPACRCGSPSPARPRRCPPALQLTAYRIVQEALTNALKHAADPTGASTRRWRAGRTVGSSSRWATTAASARRPPATGGHGLTGMRERSPLFGGELAAGPTRGRRLARARAACRCAADAA